MNPYRGSRPKRVLTAAVTALLAATSLPALASGCLEALEPLLEDTSDNCIGIPSNPKFFEASTFNWGGSERLVVNIGNELRMWTVDDPQAPVFAAESALNVPNQGDSDYDLLGFSFCDDCRFGVAAFKLGISLFDLGTMWAPGFTDDITYMTASEPQGGFTFSVGGQQYLLANALPGDCGGDATLYRFDGIYQGQFQVAGCVQVPNWNLKIVNGFHLRDGDQSYLYLGFNNRRVYQFRVDEVGGSIILWYINHGDDVPMAHLMRGRGMAIDAEHRLAVATLKTGAMHVYDISDLAHPQEIASRAGSWDLAALRYPFIWVADGAVPDSSVTWDISNPFDPRPVDQAFWDAAWPWNSHTENCEWPGGAAFSADASTLFFPRYSVVQMIGFSDCDTTVLGDGFESGDMSRWTVSTP